jgi:hypothetical protein
MKATLSFDLDEPSDSEAHKRCVKALDYGFLIQEVAEYLWRNTEKDNPDDAEAIQKRFSELCIKYDVTPGEYIS